MIYMEDNRNISVFSNALEPYEAAKYLFYTTYPAIQDPKLLLGVLNNLFTSLELAMQAVLEAEGRSFKDEFQNKLNLFAFHHSNVNMSIVSDLKEILDLHKKCPIEFRRGGKMVLCNEDYMMKIISDKDIEDFLDRTNRFLNSTKKLVNI